MRLVIEKIVYPGKSLGRLKDKAAFCDEGLPGETVDIRILGEKKDFISAETLSILEKSPFRVETKCGHYKACSSYQYIDYRAQIEIKEMQVKEIFKYGMGADGGSASGGDKKLVMPSPVIWGYRNKAHMHIVWEGKAPHLAYHKPGSTDEFVKVKKCFLLSEKLNCELEKRLDDLKNKKLYATCEITARESSCENINGKKLFFGQDSFFQINIAMLKELIDDLKKELALSGKETLADIYCGVGTFGIILSDSAKKILAVESSAGNIPFLRKNIAENNKNNISVYEGPGEYFINSVLSQKPDVIILDPPRKGLDAKITKALYEKYSGFIVYISCDPATLVRDLKILSGRFKISFLRCYDFFPHTPHIETMCMLKPF